MNKTLNSNSTGGGGRDFTKLDDALRHCTEELKVGRCVAVWPVESAGYRVAAWSFENAFNHPDYVTFAPTIPQDLSDIPNRRRSIFSRLPGARRE